MTRRHWFPKPYADVVARLRVPGGFLLVACFLWLSQPTRTSLLYGLPLSLVGLWLRGWAAGHLEKNQRLTTTGPYAWIRNPLYIGTLLTAAGLVIASRRISLALLFAGVFLLIYLPVIELEEQYLRQLFPDFDQYAARVPMLFPRVGRSPWTAADAPVGPAGNAEGPDQGVRRGRGRPPHRFTWRLYRYNREYQALAGFLACVAVLLWKAV